MTQRGLLMHRTFETNRSYLSITISYILSSITFISLSIKMISTQDTVNNVRYLIYNKI